ncbi:glycosyltransferase [uncultured Amnibacterium sp.]|uniref:glycosyltransferase n=1 Tax=uncultured Amnibacterium sp. TaxID=1631851 RepID=UPI0035CAB272
MRIRLLLRDDYPAKSGGDLVLARAYEGALQGVGLDARLEPLSAAGLDDRDGVAQVFNIDRWFEFVASARRIRASGRPLVVAPIHHPMGAVDRFESGVRSGPLGVIGRAGRGPFGRERIKHAMRNRTGRSVAEALIRDPRAAIAQALTSAALVVVQAPSETAEVQRNFGVDLGDKAVWVPNGVEVDDAVRIDGDRDIDVLLAGRIEERKNQLSVAQAFAGTDVRVTFVGGDNPRNAAYTAAFHRLVAQHPNLTHVPHVPLEQLRSMYARSSVFLSVSHFEVVSLSELEAVGYGCRLVSGANGYLRDYLGDRATYVDPAIDAERLRSVVAASLGLGVDEEAVRLVRAEYTWARTARDLVGAYRGADLLPA